MAACEDFFYAKFSISKIYQVSIVKVFNSNVQQTFRCACIRTVGEKHFNIFSSIWFHITKNMPSLIWR